MQNGLLDLHNLMRWILLIFLVLCVIKGASGMSGKKKFTDGDRKIALFLMIVTDIQLLLGLALYFMNGWFGALTSGKITMSDKYQRFWGIEHMFGMLVAIVLIHLGYAAVKKDVPGQTKFKKLFWFTFIALIIILFTIPWPFREIVGRPWFPSMGA